MIKLIANPTSISPSSPTATITAVAYDVFGNPAVARATISIALFTNLANACRLTTSVTTIPAGASNSSSAPGNVSEGTARGVCTIAGTAAGYAVQNAQLTAN